MFVLPRGRYAEMSRCLGLSGSIDWRNCTAYSTCPCKLIRLRYDSSVQRKLSVARLTGAKWEEEAAWRRDSTWNRRGVELSRPMLLSEEGEGHPSLRWLFIIVIKRKATWIYARCIWVSSILCGLAAVIIITAAVRQTSFHDSFIQ